MESSTEVPISLGSLNGTNMKIGVVDSISQEAIDSSLLVIVAYITSQSSSSSQSVDINTAIQLTKCISDTRMYCLETNIIPVLPFGSSDFLLSQNNKYLKFEIMDCLTYKTLIGSTNMPCGSSTNIADALTRAVIQLSFNQYEIDPIQYDFPVRTISREFRKKIDNSHTQIINVSVKQMEIATDKGIIQESINSIDLTSFKGISSANAGTAQTALVTVNVILDEEKYYYERTYSKVQVYLAYVGGIIKMLTMIGEFITRPFARLSLNTKIVNEVFDFEGGDTNDGSNDLISMEELQQEFHLYDENIDNFSDKSPDKLQSKSTIPVKYPSSPVEIELTDQQLNNPRVSEKIYDNLNNNNQIFVASNEQHKYQQQQSPLIKIHKTTETTPQVIHDRYRQRPRAISTIQDYLKEGRKISTLKNHQLPYQVTQCGRIMDLSKINESAQEIELRSQIDYSKGSNSNKSNQLQPPKVIIKQPFQKNELLVSSDLFNQKMNNLDLIQKHHSASPVGNKDRGKELSQILESRQNRPKLLRSSSIPLADTAPDCKYVRKQQNMQLSVIEDRESRVSNKGKSTNNNNIQEKESESKSSKKYESQGSSDSDSDDSDDSSSSDSSSQSSQSASQSSQFQSQIQSISSDKPKDQSGPMSTAHCEAMQRAFCINTMSSSKTQNKQDLLSSSEQSKQSTLKNSNNQEATISKDKRKSKKSILTKHHHHASIQSNSLNVPQDEEDVNIIPISLYNNPQNSSPEKQSHNTFFHKKPTQNQGENNQQSNNNNNYDNQSNEQKFNPSRAKLPSNFSTQNLANVDPSQATTPKRFISNFSSSQRNTSNSNYENHRNSEGVNVNLIPMKSEGASSSYSPGLSRIQNRESLASDSSSPGKSGTFKFFAGETSQNEKSADKKPQSMYALHHPRNSILFPMNRPNNRISAEYNDGNFQMRTSASPGMRRSTSKRYSVLEKQKIFALTKLMDNYQNHQETKVDELKNFEKLVHSPKKKSNNPDSIFKRLFRESKVLKLKFFDYFLYYLQFFSKMYSEKKKQIKFSKQKVKERLDVVYIIQKLVEIDKLKMLLLNEDQLKLFEYLPKPIVHMDPQEPPRSPSLKGKEIPIHMTEEQTHPSTMLQAWSMLHQQKKPIQKAIEASRVYKQMMDCDPDLLSETDKKLIDMLDLRIKEIFDVNNEIQRQKTMHTIITPGKPAIGPERIDLNRVSQINLGGSDNSINKRFMSAQLPLKVNLQKKSFLEKQSYPQSTQFMAGSGDTQNPLPPPPQLMNCKVSAFEGLPLCDETQAAFLDQDQSVTINNNNICSNLKGNTSFLFDRDITPLIEENAKQGLMIVSLKGEVLKRNQSTNVGTSSGSMQIDSKRNEGDSKAPKPPPPAESTGL